MNRPPHRGAMVSDHSHEPGWVQNPDEDETLSRAGLTHHEAIETIA